MTNDAQDRHGQGEERLTPDAGRSDSRPPTTPNPTAGPDQSRSETSGTTWMSMDEDASEGRPPRGTPTPGHQNPVGRPDEGPAVHARRLGGTAPRATNERPTAPEGSGSAPTTPRAVEQGRPTAFTPPPSQPVRAPQTGERSEPSASERPINPFEPRPEDRKKSKRSSRRSKRAPEVPSGRRVAEPEPGLGERLKKVRQPLGGRNITALTVAGVAVVAIIALIASTAFWWFNRDTEVASEPGTAMSATPGPVLGAGQMLSESMALTIDPARTWQKTHDEAGVNDSSPQIACIGPQAADQPIPQITQLRGLSASGDDRTAALHRADAYASAEDAQKVFEFRSAELGACTDTPLYVEKGLNVTGLGDEALGVRVVLQDTKSGYHSVVLVRTGRVVNLLDVARTGAAFDMTAQAKSLGQSINRQCGPALGLCMSPTVAVTDGLPPAGGAEPGFLTSGDIPRISPGSGTWRGNPLAASVDVQDGSSCEAVDFGSIGGTGVTRQMRTYLLRNDAAAPPQFGVDQVILTMGSAQEATDLAGRIGGNMSSCGTRTLTSQVPKTGAVESTGEGDVEIRGNWYVVTSKIDQAQNQHYRVAVVAAGNRLIYLRSNPTQTFDFTDEAWAQVATRAGERTTQIK